MIRGWGEDCGALVMGQGWFLRVLLVRLMVDR